MYTYVLLQSGTRASTYCTCREVGYGNEINLGQRVGNVEVLVVERQRFNSHLRACDVTHIDEM